MMPCAPEPVMLIAGLSSPITRASIAPLHMSEAVFCSSSDTSLPPFFFLSIGPNVVLSLPSPSIRSARLVTYASPIKVISLMSTVSAYSTSSASVYLCMSLSSARLLSIASLIAPVRISVPSDAPSSSVSASPYTTSPLTVMHTIFVCESLIVTTAVSSSVSTVASMKILLVMPLSDASTLPSCTRSSAASLSSGVTPASDSRPLSGSPAM